VADRLGHGTPYPAVCLIYGLTESPLIGPWIRGKLTLAGVDLRTDAGAWLDSVYALWIEQPPTDALERAQRAMVIGSARLAPDRETWGALPEQQALGVARLTKGTGYGAPR
jgi:hypothetical protein